MRRWRGRDGEEGAVGEASVIQSVAEEGEGGVGVLFGWGWGLEWVDVVVSEARSRVSRESRDMRMILSAAEERA